MIVSCDNCGKKYNVREDQLGAEKTRFKCTACNHHFNIERPISAPREKKIEEIPTTPVSAEKTVRLGLIFKVVSLMLAVSLVPLATFWGINFTQSSSRTRQDTEALISQITEGLSGQVDEWIDKNIRILNALTNLEDMQSMEQERQTPLLKAVDKEYPWTYLIFTTDRFGANIARSDGKSLKDYSDRSYFRQVINGKKLAWQTLIGKTSKKPALVLAVPIEQRGRTVGVLASAMTIDNISDRIATWRRGETGFAFLVDETNKVVAHQIKSYSLEQKDLSGHPLVAGFRRGKAGIHYFSNEKGEACIGNIHPTKYGWGMAIQQSEKEAFEALGKAQRLAFIMLVGTVIVVSFVAYLLGRAIVVPIRKLTDVAERISMGDLEVQIQIDSKDEIAVLGNAISRLQDSMRLSIERFSRRRRSRR